MKRRPAKRSLLDDAFDLFVITPIWVGPIAAAIVYVLFRYVAPSMFQPKVGQADVGMIVRDLLPLLAWVFTGATLLAWIAAEFLKLKQRRLFDSQTGIESIRNLSWKEFEHLVCEAYRRQGYLAEVVGHAAGDGGVDVGLRGRGETILVQCKQWRAYTVGVSTVREMLGVVVSQKASRGIVATSGRFTAEAARFAQRNPQVELVDGDGLAELVRVARAQGDSGPPIAEPGPTVEESQLCPLCGSAMQRRQARRGANAGSWFWGCQRYPACRGTRPVLGV